MIRVTRPLSVMIPDMFDDEKDGAYDAYRPSVVDDFYVSLRDGPCM